ncbi:MAG: VOC family protein [Candidatus Kariarchaeaceae archaeon]|jgi:predicted enzyme related to lactoylglutathione lyase
MVDKINHVEIPVTDLEKSKAFYGPIFDWDIDLEMMPNYGLVDIKGAVSIGFFIVEAIPERGINIVIEVNDIPSKLIMIKEAGGTIVREKYLIGEEIGYAADFTDIFGNQLSLFSHQ